MEHFGIFTLYLFWRMPFSGMWCCVALVRTDIFQECITSIIRVKRISELGIMLAVTSNWSMLQLLFTAYVVPNWLILFTLIMEPMHSSKTGSYKSHMALHPRRQYFTQSLPWKPQSLHTFILFYPFHVKPP
jgi:hypothetical protein